MGHIIEEEAQRRGHEIVCTIDQNEEYKYDSEAFKRAQVAIEFSVPTAAVGNIKACIGAGVPLVCGTTGWLSVLPEIAQMCLSENGKMIYASNFSIGVNIFQAVNRYLAKLMETFPAYTPRIEETHHIHKLDHPSGTALTTAEIMIDSNSRLHGWKEGEETAESEVKITCRREGEVPGIHTIVWDSEEDTLTLSHSAKSRRGFALGAVMAAEWIVGKDPGLYSVNDMLAEITKTTNIFR